MDTSTPIPIPISENDQTSVNTAAAVQHGEIDLEQAALLQDMARGVTSQNSYARSRSRQEDSLDGPIEETPSSGAGSVSHSSGDIQHAVPATSIYPNPPGAEDGDSPQDDIDPAALLESLANYEQGPISEANGSNMGESEAQMFTSMNVQPQTNQFENDHFASLLQAAETAEQDSHARRQLYQTQPRGPLEQSESWERRMTTPSIDQNAVLQPPRTSKRKHSSAAQDTSAPSTLRSSRRQKTDSTHITARERSIWGSPSPSLSAPKPSSPPLSPPSARVAGVHSAAALFRKPSPASKRYTRPPMSKLFTSLELSPENFLHLQAAAKAYMLEESHPERFECVGSKGGNDTDMVKLKLFACVESFLEDEGWGERCWGVNKEGRIDGKLVWPEERTRCVIACTPLLRRMVTNERQRRYAVETRGRGKEKAGKGGCVVDGNSGRDVEKMGDFHYAVEASFQNAGGTPLSASTELEASISRVESARISIVAALNSPQSAVLSSDVMKLSKNTSFDEIESHIRLLAHNTRMQYPELEGGRVQFALHVLTPSRGLVSVKDADEWGKCLEEINDAEWMDSRVTVVAVLGTSTEAQQ